MSDHRVKIDLTKLVQQAIDQLADSDGQRLLQRWLDRQDNRQHIVEIELDSVLARPDEAEFCPRCGYETVNVRAGQARCRTCGLSWLIED